MKPKLHLSFCLMEFCLTFGKALRASPNRERLGKERNGYPPFGFIMNIKRQLKESRGIHNSWVLITLPTPVIEDNSSEDTVISLAAHIRLTIERVRSPECLEPLIDMHRNARPKPIAARDLASKPPLTVVSSCIQPWYQTEFQINPDTTARPRHIEIFCRGSGILKRMVKVEHLIFTWKDELDQFCLRGVLATEVWKELQGYLL